MHRATSGAVGDHAVGAMGSASPWATIGISPDSSRRRITTDTMRRPCDPLGAQLEPLEASRTRPRRARVPSRLNNKPADGVPLGVGQLDAERLAHVVDRRAPGHPQRAVREVLDRRRRSTSYSSAISPTISSSRSSSVTSPAVPPCSSNTIAMWNCSVCISLQQLGDALLLGHEHGRRAASRAPAWSPSPARARCTRSLRYTSPMMSSVLPS